MRWKATKPNTLRLRDKACEPPRKPDLLTKPLVVAIDDRTKGAQYGKGRAYDYDMTDEDGRLHIDRQIDEQVARAAADQRNGFAGAIKAATEIREDAIEQQDDAERELATLDEQDAVLMARAEELGHRHGPGRFGYGVALVVLFLLVLPIDVGAAQLLPLAPAMQALLAVLLGAGMVWAAHYAAKKVHDLPEAYARRDDDRFAFVQECILAAIAVVVPLTVIVGTTIWRAQAFKEEAKMTGALVQGGAANVAFATIALLAFAVAALAGIAFRHMAPVREVRRNRRRLARKRRRWQNNHDAAERVERQAEITITFLHERREETLEALVHWGEERKARIRQRAATVEMKTRRREQRRGGDDDPGAGVRAVRPTQPKGPRPLPDLGRAANEVQNRANAQAR